MHTFTDLVDRSTAFTLAALTEANERASDAMQTSAATPLVKTLQMVRLQRVIMAVGMFSIFEATLQRGLACKDGFKQAGEILEQKNEIALKEMFSDLRRAINVLKHGQGRSYNELVEKAGELNFRVKLPGEHFFSEGDVSEIATLVEVDDRFVRLCAEVIRDVSHTLKAVRPEFIT